MAADDLGHGLGDEVGDEVGTEHGMPAHLRPLPVVERRRLDEDPTRQSALADVVHDRRELEDPELAAGQAELAADGNGNGRHHPRVVVEGRVDGGRRGEKGFERPGKPSIASPAKPLCAFDYGQLRHAGLPRDRRRHGRTPFGGWA